MDMTALVLTIIGALNWALVGISSLSGGLDLRRTDRPLDRIS